jgi:hypothetical protein
MCVCTYRIHLCGKSSVIKSLIMNSDSSGSTGERDLLIVSFIWKILMEYTPDGRILEDNTSH